MNKIYDVKITKSKAKHSNVTYFECEWNDLRDSSKRQKVSYSLTDKDISIIKESKTMKLENAITSGFVGAATTMYFVTPPETDEELALEEQLNDLKKEIIEAVNKSDVID